MSSRAEVSSEVGGLRSPDRAIGSGAAAVSPRQRLSGDEWLMRGLTLGFAVWLVLALLLPVATVFLKSLQGRDGSFVGWANYATYLTSPSLLEGLRNSLFVAGLTTVITIGIALPFAFALTRTCMPFKGVLRGVALLKLLTPALLPAIAIRYLLGNNGYLSWIIGDHSVFGPIGIVIGLVFYTFPHALLILTAAFGLADARLYEAASSLGASKWRILRTVILPGAKLGIASAVIVVFTLAITDFSVPKVTGGDYNVLATDIYTQIIGRQNFGIGATIAIILLMPAVVAFAVDLAVRRRQVATLTSESVPFQPRPNRLVDMAFLAFCGVVCGLILLVLGVAVWASLLQYWPYNLNLTLSHYDLSKVAGNGFQGYINSLKMSLLTAVVGTAVIFSGAYLVEKGRGFRTIRHMVHFLSVLPLAVPGLVLGLAYVFFLANENNPLSFLYGTMAILVISTIVHYYPVGHLVAVTSLKQMDGAFESVSASMSVPFYKSFMRITVPICLPSILDISIYLFVTAMTTTSAVIFLYSHDTIVATVTIINLEESGLTASALAMGVLVVLTSGAVRVLHWIVTRQLLSRSQAWRHR